MHIQDTLSFCLCPKLGAVLRLGWRRRERTNKNLPSMVSISFWSFLYFKKINYKISMAYNTGHMWNHQDLSYLRV